MSSFLNLLSSFFQSLLLILTSLREKSLRDQGRDAVLNEQLTEAYDNLGESHEIDSKVARGDLSDTELERLRQYQRD